jgi:putative flippase GtrA
MTLKDWFWGPAKNTFVEFFRSLFVGGVAFVVDAGILVVLKETGLLSATAASIVSFVFGLIVNYLLSVYWVFKQSNVDSASKRFLIFAVCGVIGMAMNSGIIWVFDVPLASAASPGGLISPDRYYMVGKIVSTVVVFFWNFFSRKLLLFRGDKEK